MADLPPGVVSSAPPPEMQDLLVRQYRNSYASASRVKSAGTLLCVIGLLTTAAQTVFSVMILSQPMSQPPIGVCLGMIASILLSIVGCYAVFVLFAAVGDGLLASVDSAVSTSPLLSAQAKRELLTGESRSAK